MKEVILSLLREVGVTSTKTIHTRDYAEQVLAPCPFHKNGQERNPSFVWHTVSGLYFCHACHAAGNVAMFARKFQTTTSIEGVALVLPTFGVKEERPPCILPEWVLGTYRFLSKAMLQTFPRELLVEYEVGYDLEQHRIIFPVRDIYGNLLGVSGRIDGGYSTDLRYKFYESEFHAISADYHFEKSRTLWNAHRLFASCVTRYNTQQEEPMYFVVEGFRAALHLLHLGYPHALALMGSTMSDDQRRILSFLGGDVLLLLDNDDAGRRGSEEIYKTLLHHSACRPHLLRYPSRETKQPDDLTLPQLETMIHGVLQ